MIIGITGNSGSGKSEIASILAQKIKAEIIDADLIVKELSEPEHTYYKKIIELFGEGILEGKKLNKKKIADIIYKDKMKREQLNNLTYIYIVNEIESRVKNIENRDIIIDAPLLFESGLDKICNFTIAVLADEQIKIERICKRDNLDLKTAKHRLSIQEKDKFYISKADYIIKNNKKKEEINLEEICTKIGKN